MILSLHLLDLLQLGIKWTRVYLVVVALQINSLSVGHLRVGIRKHHVWWLRVLVRRVLHRDVVSHIVATYRRCVWGDCWVYVWIRVHHRCLLSRLFLGSLNLAFTYLLMWLHRNLDCRLLWLNSLVLLRVIICLKFYRISILDLMRVPSFAKLSILLYNN